MKGSTFKEAVLNNTLLFIISMLESSWPSEQRVKYTGSVFLDQLNVRRLRCATLRWLRNDDEGEKLELKHLPAFSVQHEAQVD